MTMKAIHFFSDSLVFSAMETFLEKKVFWILWSHVYVLQLFMYIAYYELKFLKE